MKSRRNKFTLYLSDEELNILKIKSDEMKMSKNDFIRRLINEPNVWLDANLKLFLTKLRIADK